MNTTYSTTRRQQIRHVDVKALFEKLPPHALEAECALLGSMILDWRVCGDVLQILNGSTDFYKQGHAAIYDSLLELYNDQQSIDMVQLKQKLEDKSVLEHVGGTDYLIKLAESVPSAASATHYAKIVREKALMRSLIQALGESLDDVYNSDESPQAVVEAAQQAVFALTQQQEGKYATDLHSLLNATLEQLEQGGEDHFIKTGFYELDEMLGGGLRSGEMIIIAARPSQGKSALALSKRSPTISRASSNSASG